MGLFDFFKGEKKGIAKSQEIPVEIKEKSYASALNLLQKTDFESQRAGREMMVSLANVNGLCDPRVSLWMANDYETHGCLGAAAKWYKIALKQGVREAESGYKRCFNPYHIDPYYSINGTRGCGTPHLRYAHSIEEKAKQDYRDAISKLENTPSEAVANECLRTIYQIASANQCCVPEAQKWMGDFCETVQKDNVEAARWFKKAADNNSAEGARCYADMVISGRGIEKNETEAIKYYQKAADLGQIESMFVLGQYYYKHGDEEKARVYLKKSAGQGFTPSQEMLDNLDRGNSIFERPKYQIALDNVFSEIVIKNDLSDNGLIEFFADIYQPDDFCQSVFDYCNKQYEGKGQEKLTFEYNMTSFYGGICSVALWNKNNGAFSGVTAWNAIKRFIDVEFTDRHAEELLGTKNGEDKAEKIYGLIQEYMQISRAAMMVCQYDRNACIYAMRLAYKLGMLIAKKEFPLSNKNFIREFIVNNNQETSNERVTLAESEDAFYTRCLKEFHDIADELGVASHGVIFIPELMPCGKKMILELLRDPYYQSKYSHDPKAYYAAIMSLCIEAGIAFGAKWHEDITGLIDYTKAIIESGPKEDAEKLMRKYLPQGLFCNEGEPFFRKVYSCWTVLHEPYWKLEDPRDYTFKLMLAAYQLGISIILERYGF